MCVHNFFINHSIDMQNLCIWKARIAIWFYNLQTSRMVRTSTTSILLGIVVALFELLVCTFSLVITIKYLAPSFVRCRMV